jgi:hypothetical protein
MTLRQARDLLKYWRRDPPLHEVIGIVARALTAWNPEEQALAELSEEERQVALQQERERRLRSGVYFDPRRAGAEPSDGTMPGIGPFPGSPAALRAAAEAAAKATHGK